MSEKVEIERDKPLKPGDIVELHFRSWGMTWLRAAQIAAIEHTLSRETHWRIISSEIPETNRVIFRVQVIKSNPIIVTVAVIAAAIMGVGFMTWLTFDKAYQILETPAGRLGIAGLGTMGLAAGIMALLALLPNKK